MRKEYPKVPNHYNTDAVDSALFEADDLTILEKLDGSNARLCVYDDRWETLYADAVHAADPSHGDIFIGSKTRIRGKLSDPASSFDGNFGRLITHLRETLNADALLELHQDYSSPLILFGEHMVKHSLDYEYETNPPPAFLGFDVFRMADFTTPPANPFNEDFTGFLSLDDAWDVFSSIGLDTVAVLDSDATGVDPESFTVPLSEYGAVQAEGVIFRSDSQSTRVKYVTAEFRERMHNAWGMNESDASTGAELFIARYLTNARLRKHVHKLVHDHGENAVTPETVATRAVADAWGEDIDDIRTISIPLTPSDIHTHAYDRAQEVLHTMRTNAALNDTTLDTLWADHDELPSDDTLSELDADSALLDIVHAAVEGQTDTHQSLVQLLLPPDRVHEVAERYVSDDDREMGRWVIEPTREHLQDDLWYGSTEILSNLTVAFTPAELDETLFDYIAAEIESRDDVYIPDGSDNWSPDPDEMDGSGIGDLF